ncbi:hypothetical protein CVT24_002538 [Panaeolus cyanescens]|uniref:Uncharacterized protein n=1 Tax=Panaeolus cyanescens TaxID=181874 RepID=A0A409WB02_9AGAR|nr:hypothetical protein CVT24_002538 [Panaeolus cyanescens]
MPSISRPSVQSKLEFRVVYNENLPILKDSHIVDIALEQSGGFLAIAMDTHVSLYECDSSDSEKHTTPVEKWDFKGTFKFQNSQARITSMSWTSADILAIALNTGDITLIRANSQEIISKGFQVSYEPIKMIVLDRNLQYMAIAAGSHEISIWESTGNLSEWIPHLYVPLHPALEDSKDAEATSIHWNHGYDKPVLVVAYRSWDLDFQTNEANILQTSTMRPPIVGGMLSPDGNLFGFPDPYQPDCYMMNTLRPGSNTRPRLYQCDEAIQPPFTAKFMFGGDWLVAPGIDQLYLWHVETERLVTRLPLDAPHFRQRIISLSVRAHIQLLSIPDSLD